MFHVQRRILEHLGAAGVLLVVGCREPEAPTPAPDAASSGTATAPLPSVVATATAAASVTATASAVAPGGADVGGVCKTAEDCKPGLHCQLDFDGATFSETGRCTTERPIYRGRPLYVGGQPRVASLLVADSAGADDSWAGYFARAAVEEHASIAAFARTVCQLMALGAPLELLGRTSRALDDEIEHARGSLAWLAHFGGAELAPGPLPDALAPLAASVETELEQVARELLIDVVRGGCVGETLAAEAMLERAAHTSDPALAAWLERVAEDEARHAALAFETAVWLVRAYPALAPVVQREVELSGHDARSSQGARTTVAALFEATGLSARVAA